MKENITKLLNIIHVMVELKYGESNILTIKKFLHFDTTFHYLSLSFFFINTKVYFFL